MNIQELSVGDWIKTTDKDFRGSRECTIQNIEKWRNNYVLVVKFKDGSIETLGLNCFEPIPLTPEILKKNCFVEHKGFNETYEYTTLLGTTLRQCIITKYHSKQFNGLTVREVDTKKKDNDLERVSKFLNLIIPEVCVHHLQYAFRIIHPNEEIQIKEIKL